MWNIWQYLYKKHWRWHTSTENYLVKKRWAKNASKPNAFRERLARNGSKVTWLNKATFCSSYPLFKNIIINRNTYFIIERLNKMFRIEDNIVHKPKKGKRLSRGFCRAPFLPLLSKEQEFLLSSYPPGAAPQTQQWPLLSWEFLCTI